MGKKVGVLVVDDSPICRQLICDALARDPDMEIVGTAANGSEAVSLTVKLRPNVITMDVDMPVMDGLTAVEHIMAERPTPILLLTGDPRYQAPELTYRALELGALALQIKPSIDAEPEAWNLAREVKLLASVKVIRHVRGKVRGAGGSNLVTEPQLGAGGMGVVAVAASTGGPQVLHDDDGRGEVRGQLAEHAVQHLGPTRGGRHRDHAHAACGQLRLGVQGGAGRAAHLAAHVADDLHAREQLHLARQVPRLGLGVDGGLDLQRQRAQLQRAVGELRSLVARVPGEQEDGRGALRHDVLAGGEAVHHRHVHVHRDDVGLQDGQALERFAPVLGRAGDLDARVEPQHLTDELAADERVIDDQHPDLLAHGGVSLPLRRSREHLCLYPLRTPCTGSDQASVCPPWSRWPRKS